MPTTWPAIVTRVDTEFGDELGDDEEEGKEEGEENEGVTKIFQKGTREIWKPDVTVVHYRGTTDETETDDTQAADDELEGAVGERDDQQGDDVDEGGEHSD